ncbi:TcdA/TcdB pore-forming domain-containing protein [Pseudomonas sp.]|uniref:TcdA/TcdB pore-forming domain-containing protein n=1 Tax=Pseudomonas sp. TaxID=306 RepID=UPI003F2CCAEC
MLDVAGCVYFQDCYKGMDGMNQYQVLSSAGKSFLQHFKSDIQTLTNTFNAAPEFDALSGYYDACTKDQRWTEQVAPLLLFKDTLGSLIGQRAGPISPALADLSARLENYSNRLVQTVRMLNPVAPDVPKTMHFVWVGGSAVGAIQRDYINIWKEIMVKEGHTFNLWYDSDAVLAFEMNRVILESARAHAMASGGATITTPVELARMIEHRARVLKMQMSTHLRQKRWAGKADEARIDLMVRAYGKDEATLIAFRQKCLDSHLAMVDEHLRLRDVREVFKEHLLWDVYEREVAERGNFAAASDVVRLQVEAREGGRYSDVDYLPQLKNRLGTVDITSFDESARIGVLQLLLNHNKSLMPGRDPGRYTDRTMSIPAEHRNALTEFALQRPGASEIFSAPQNSQTPTDGIRMAVQFNSEMNSHVVAHAGAGSTQAIIELIRFNYDFLSAFESRLNTAGADWSNNAAVQDILVTMVSEKMAEVPALSRTRRGYLGKLAGAIGAYYSDGIRYESRGTIDLTGPGAAITGLEEYVEKHLLFDGKNEIRDRLKLSEGYNVATEEEKVSGWTINATPQVWLQKEQANWVDGKVKTRYQGDFSELLKGQTIRFDKGWPVIEGRHVLSTQVLHSLAQHLGKPFLRAMSQRTTDEVTFDKPLQLSFDERQSILAQEVALPPSLVGESAPGDLPLDELLHRMGRGTLQVEQLDPRQRLWIGSLLGAQAMDQRNFDQVSARLENLANNVSELGVSHRYGAIERELLKENHPAFVEGLGSALAPFVALSETSVELKKQALEQSLTLLQWGRQVARIQQVAKLEFRDRISERMTDVLGSFDQGTFKLVPQDLLLQGDGDRIAGRCYPLALAMAAAISKGNEAGNSLRERFYLAVIEPDASDSSAFVSILEELRDVDVHDLGGQVVRSDLTQVIATLEEETGDRTLMLNSDNHSMLLAKSFVGEGSTYHFYDPNFGVFEFDTAQALSAALTHFFIRQEMAKPYAAYGKPELPAFDLIELDVARLNATVLPSGVRVSSLSDSGSLPGQAPRARQRLASARGRSLVNNGPLGSSLLELDAHWWGRQIAQATRQLQEQHGLSSGAVALFETLEITPAGEYKISLVDSDPARTLVRVTTDDPRFLRIRNYLSETFHALAAQPHEPVGSPDPTDAGSVHTLNAGFTVQALMNALRHHEGAASGGDQALTTAIRLHAYVNYAQLVHGNVVDVIGVVTLVRQALDDEKLIARTSAPLVQKALGHVANEGVGTVLGLVNVGFDIYQLSHATNDIEKAQFGTQLAFDSASAVLGAAGLGAALAGAGTVAAVLGGVGVILGGLAVGVAALAEGFATIAEEAKEVARFFEGLEKACLQGGYHLDTAANAWIAHPLLVFADLDLRASTVRFDSPKLFPLRDHFGVPDFDVDYEHATDIRVGLGLPDSAPFSPQPGQTIVLPGTPKTWYGYEYKLLPFVTFRHAGGFDTARRLEKKNEQGQWQFLFSFYSFPGEYVVNRLNPVYKPTAFNVRLDNIERSLVVPALPKAWHGLVSYWIEGAGAQCSVLLNPGVNVELNAPGHTAMRWVLHAPWLAEADIRVAPAGCLVADSLGVKFTGGGVHDVVLKLAGNAIMRVDLVALKLEVVEAEADPALGEQALLDHFKSLAREHRLAMPYTPVHNFVVPFEKPDEPRTVVAYYDSAQDRFLYIRDPNVLLSDEVVLGAVVEGSAYFYHPESFEVWQVDAITGTLVKRYRLLVRQGVTIARCEAVANGGIQVVQQSTPKDGPHDELTFMIHDGSVLLGSITRGHDPALQAVLAADTLTDWTRVLGNYVLPAESIDTVNWRPAALVSICWQFEGISRDLVWVRDADGLIVRAAARRHHTRGWEDSIKALNSLLLIAPAGAEGEVFVTYDKSFASLVRQQRSIVEGRAHWSTQEIAPRGLKNVVCVEQGYLALTDAGLFFNMTPEGYLRLGGLTETWFKDRALWWSALPAVSIRYPVSSFALLGLTNFIGDAGLCAWYLDDRLLLADLGHGKEVRLLSVTPDNQAVWLFDLSTGKIFRQRFIDTKLLSAAFGQGTRLLQAQILPAPRQEWAPWTFTDVKVEGAGLGATTLDGIEMDLQHNEPVRITGVDIRWVTALEGPLSEGLAALANEHRCADFLSVEDPDSLQWYVVRTGRLIRIPKATVTAQYTLIGTREKTNVMLHEHGDGQLRTYPDESSVGPLDYVQRNTDVLVVEGPKTAHDLLPLIADDVRILVLKMGQGATTGRLTRAAWLKLDSVIVDCRYPLERPPLVPGKLILDASITDEWWVSLVDEHLVMNGLDSGHSLIFRGVYSADVALRGDVFLSLNGYRSCAVSQIVTELLKQKGITGSATLTELISKYQIGVSAEPAFQNVALPGDYGTR